MSIKKRINISKWLPGIAAAEILLLLCVGFALLIKGTNDESAKLAVIGSLSMLFALGMANFLLLFSISERLYLRGKHENHHP